MIESIEPQGALSELIEAFGRLTPSEMRTLVHANVTNKEERARYEKLAANVSGSVLVLLSARAVLAERMQAKRKSMPPPVVPCSKAPESGRYAILHCRDEHVTPSALPVAVRVIGKVTAIVSLFAVLACGGGVDGDLMLDSAKIDAGTYATCRPLSEPDAPLKPTLVWIAPGPKSDWAPCEGMTAQGIALWCCEPDAGK